MSKKVAIGLSGGVDSSVSAKILKDAGHEVVGLFMKLWFDPTCSVNRENACCDDKALLDARAVADQLGIRLYVVDVRGEFKSEIVDYFVDTYGKLETPNPCVLCNKKIKFGWMLDFAKKIGCDYVATGHYARIKDSSQLSIINYQLSINKQLENDQLNDNWKLENDNYHLLRGVDDTKDQSYFLHQLDQAQLSRILLPVGDMTKVEVRALAKAWVLPVFEKVESQEICFVDDDYRVFLKKYLPASYFESGDIIDQGGQRVGVHEGLVNYTIGQRRGVNQSISNSKNSLDNEAHKDKKPLYVTGFDCGKNQLIVGEETALYKNEMIVDHLNLIILETDIEKLINLTVKIRYRAKSVICHISKSAISGQYIVRFDEPVRSITPGQSAVFYLGDEVIGGGIIKF
ncbi:MAG: tRNA 2-thiouridine(34) synthase MnmA [bacterium]